MVQVNSENAAVIQRIAKKDKSSTQNPQFQNELRFFTKGASLMPLIEDPSTIDWKSAVFWQVIS